MLWTSKKSHFLRLACNFLLCCVTLIWLMILCLQWSEKLQLLWLPAAWVFFQMGNGRDIWTLILRAYHVSYPFFVSSRAWIFVSEVCFDVSHNKILFFLRVGVLVFAIIMYMHCFSSLSPKNIPWKLAFLKEFSFFSELIHPRFKSKGSAIALPV